jgi:uncharacterized oligopeptide transporter (OPT) family protein
MKGIIDKVIEKRKYDEKQKERISNTGILLSSGLIAGEALIGLLFAGLAFADIKIFHMFEQPSFIGSIIAIVIIGMFLILIPLKKKEV